MSLKIEKSSLVKYSHYSSNLVIFLYLLICIPLCFIGYGSDFDSYLVLDAGKKTFGQGNLTMSRHPGYWIHELIVYYSALLSKYLPNFLSLTFGFLSLKILHRMLDRLKVENGFIFISICAFNPWFIIASTTTMDYIFALFFIALGIFLFQEKRGYFSGIFFGVASMFRLGSLFPVVGFLIASVVYERKYFRIAIISFILMVLLVIANYSLSYIAASNSFSFLEPHMGGENTWTFFMYIGRFFYNSIYLLGLPLLTMIILMLPLIFTSLPLKSANNMLLFGLIGGCLGNIVLFARYPIETPYLLPLLFCLSAILAILLSKTKRVYMILLLIAAVTPNIININIARPDTPNAATSANFGFWVEKGILISHLEERIKFSECINASCYQEVIRN